MIWKDCGLKFARLFSPFRSRRLAQFEVLAGRIGVVDLNWIFKIENALFPVAVLIPEEAVDAIFTHDAHPCIHQRQMRTAMKPRNATPARMEKREEKNGRGCFFVRKRSLPSKMLRITEKC